jgi:hypothetical protein
MLKKRNYITLFVVLLLLFSMQIAWAGIKVAKDNCPVFVSSHEMGDQVIQYPRGMYSIMGLTTGFITDRFPVNVTFKTLTNFISVARYQPVINSLVLTDSSGKNNMGRYEFDMKFDRSGSLYTQVVDWKVSFPIEGFYAINIFVDGTLVGYYPFYVGLR